jgi:hypothetical protein
MSKFEDILQKESDYIKTHIAPSFILQITEAHEEQIGAYEILVDILSERINELEDTLTFQNIYLEKIKDDNTK